MLRRAAASLGGFRMYETTTMRYWGDDKNLAEGSALRVTQVKLTTVDDFVSVKASKNHKVQQPATSDTQPCILWVPAEAHIPKKIVSRLWKYCL